MGSVQQYEDCLRCGSENCFSDYYKTGEKYMNCPDCGYCEEYFYKRNEEGKLIKKDESKGFEFDNLIMEHVLRNPYAAYRLKLKDCIAYECGSVEEDGFDDFVTHIIENKDIEFFVTSMLSDGKIIKTIHIGEIPNEAYEADNFDKNEIEL